MYIYTFIQVHIYLTVKKKKYLCMSTYVQTHIYVKNGNVECCNISVLWKQKISCNLASVDFSLARVLQHHTTFI